MNRLAVCPIYVPRRIIVQKLGINIGTVAGTGGSVGLVGIYADVDDGYGGYPGALVSGSSGSIDTTAATGLREVVINATLNPGLYWLAFVAQTSVPTMSLINSNTQVIGANSAAVPTRCTYVQDAVSGALPATFSTAPYSTGFAPFVQMLVNPGSGL